MKKRRKMKSIISTAMVLVMLFTTEVQTSAAGLCQDREPGTSLPSAPVTGLPTPEITPELTQPPAPSQAGEPSIPAETPEKQVSAAVGRVSDPDGRAVPDAAVRLESQTLETLSTGTDDQGMFRFEDVPNGRYTLDISKNGYEEHRQEIELPKDSHMDVRLPRDGSAPEISIEYDNNQVSHEKYFKSPRTAVITLSDEDFINYNETWLSLKVKGGGQDEIGVCFNLNGAVTNPQITVPDPDRWGEVKKSAAFGEGIVIDTKNPEKILIRIPCTA